MSCSFVVTPHIPLPLPPGTMERAAAEYSTTFKSRTLVRLCYYIEVEENAHLPPNINIQPLLTRDIVNRLMLEVNKDARFTQKLLLQELQKCEENIALLTDKVKELEEKLSTFTAATSKPTAIEDDGWIELNNAIHKELHLSPISPIVSFPYSKTQLWSKLL